ISNAPNGSGNVFFGVDTGTSTGGAAYSYGSSGASDRALGSQAATTNSNVPRFGALIRNTTGQTLTEFTLTYRQEQWRVGSASVATTLVFSYQVNPSTASIDASGTFTTVSALGCTLLK